MKIYGYEISKAPDSSCYMAARDGQRTLYARTRADLTAAIRENLADEYLGLAPRVCGLLRDYLRKLEVDDYDQYAVQKMADVNEMLKKLQGRM